MRRSLLFLPLILVTGLRIANIALGPTFPPPVGQDLRIVSLGPTIPPPVVEDLR